MEIITLTNLLITILIMIVAYIGKKVDERIQSIGKDIQNILLSDLEHKKDIEFLKDNYDDHEVRITNLETKR